jgi:hypothetical protein
MTGKCGVKGKGFGGFGDECEHKTDCSEELRCIDGKCDQVTFILNWNLSIFSLIGVS